MSVSQFPLHNNLSEKFIDDFFNANRNIWSKISLSIDFELKRVKKNLQVITTWPELFYDPSLPTSSVAISLIISANSMQESSFGMASLQFYLLSSIRARSQPPTKKGSGGMVANGNICFNIYCTISQYCNILLNIR